MEDATAYLDSRYLSFLVFIEASDNNSDRDNKIFFRKNHTMLESKTSPRLKYMGVEEESIILTVKINVNIAP
jgi:hypothetical protein